jgi:hypothetical protein
VEVVDCPSFGDSGGLKDESAPEFVGEFSDCGMGANFCHGIGNGPCFFLSSIVYER